MFLNIKHIHNKIVKFEVKNANIKSYVLNN